MHTSNIVPRSLSLLHLPTGPVEVVTERSMHQSKLLDLPIEIRAIIWKYAFGNTDISLYFDTGEVVNEIGCPTQIFGSDCSECEECNRSSPVSRRAYEPRVMVRGFPCPDGIRQLPWEYHLELEPLLTCKTFYSEAINLFQATMTLHVKSSETLAYIQSSAPLQLRERITRIVLYIHFQELNQVRWYVRLIELRRTLPGLKHISINYHMAAPSSYGEIADAIYMSTPLFTLNPPFNKPLYVATSQSRSTKCSRIIDGRTIAATDPRPGLTIHTAYKRQDILFSSELLGDVGTEDVIDEHTLVIRTLFEDPDYIAAANTFLASDDYYRLWKDYGPWECPKPEVPGEVMMIRGGRELYDAIEQISHRYERPWFDRLQRKRIVELYMEGSGISRENAEERLERNLERMVGDEKLTIILASLIQTDL